METVIPLLMVFCIILQWQILKLRQDLEKMKAREQERLIRAMASQLKEGGRSTNAPTN